MISNDINQNVQGEQVMARGQKPGKTRKPKKTWTKKKKRIVAGSIIGGVLLLAGAAVAAWYLFFQPEPIIDIEPEPVKYYSPLTGVEVDSEAKTKLPVTAVMVENSPEARPQSGLVGNNVVFEAIAEGGITRFNVLFQEDQPELAGPVRSLRAYYLEWASGFDSSQAHVGGSAEALTMIQSGSYALDIDETTSTFPIWRVSDRYAPHNAYTDGASLVEFASQHSKTTSEFTAWERQDGAQIKPQQNEEVIDGEDPVIDTNIYANSINLPVSTGLFMVDYEYNAETNSYDRFQGGAIHNDREKGQISPNVVIAMMVDFRPTYDAKAHNEITTIGSGVAYIFQNGVVEKCTWSKTSAKSNIEFTNEDGENVKLNRGQTWITAIDNTKNPTWQ